MVANCLNSLTELTLLLLLIRHYHLHRTLPKKRVTSRVLHSSRRSQWSGSCFGQDGRRPWRWAASGSRCSWEWRWRLPWRTPASSSSSDSPRGESTSSVTQDPVWKTEIKQVSNIVSLLWPTSYATLCLHSDVQPIGRISRCPPANERTNIYC